MDKFNIIFQAYIMKMYGEAEEKNHTSLTSRSEELPASHISPYNYRTVPSTQWTGGWTAQAGNKEIYYCASKKISALAELQQFVPSLK
jgi:hypothetical protein